MILNINTHDFNLVVGNVVSDTYLVDTDFATPMYPTRDIRFASYLETLGICHHSSYVVECWISLHILVVSARRFFHHYIVYR